MYSIHINYKRFSKVQLQITEGNKITIKVLNYTLLSFYGTLWKSCTSDKNSYFLKKLKKY